MAEFVRQQNRQQREGERNARQQRARMPRQAGENVPGVAQIQRFVLPETLLEPRAHQHGGEHRQQEEQNGEAKAPAKKAQSCRFPYCRVCNSFPGLKRTALPGGIATSAPVRGLRPMPVFRGRTLKIPKPRNSILSPDANARFMLSKTVSTAISALVFVIPVRLTTSLIISSLIKLVPFLRRAGLPLADGNRICRICSNRFAKIWQTP